MLLGRQRWRGSDRLLDVGLELGSGEIARSRGDSFLVADLDGVAEATAGGNNGARQRKPPGQGKYPSAGRLNLLG